MALVLLTGLPLQSYALELVQRLVSPDADVRANAEVEFHKLPPEAQQRFAPDLMVSLSDDNPEVRAQAKRLLQELGAANPDLKINAVREVPKQAAPARSDRLDTLKSIHKDTQDSFPDMQAEMKKEKFDAPEYSEVFKSEHEGFNTHAALLESLKDPDPWVRSRAARRLALVHPIPVEAIPTLIDLLKDQDTEVRASAAGALGSIGPAARQAIPALLHTLGDSDQGVRQIAGDALKQIQPSRN
jgi:HEAT repeat protein